MSRIVIAGLLLLTINLGLATNSIHAKRLPSIDLNRANVQQLTTLKGIGPKKAQAIVTNRKQQGKFHSLNDLKRVKGIGDNFLRRLLTRNAGRLAVDPVKNRPK